MTPEEHLAAGEELQTAARHHLVADRHDRAQSCAVMAASHFTAYAATVGARAIEEARQLHTATATPEENPAAATPQDDLISLLQSALAGRVRRHPLEKTVKLLYIPGQNPVDVTEQVDAAEKAGLLTTDLVQSTRWVPTHRGLETLDRGAV